MDENKSDLKPVLEKMARIVGFWLETAYDGVNIIEHHIFEVLDEQIVNRLLSQYDKLVKAGFTHQEALDAVTNLIKRRLETAVQEQGKERSQNDN